VGDATYIAIAGIAGTAIAAVGTPFVSGRFELRRDRVSRDHERIVELRDLLDDAGQTISSAVRALDDVRGAVTYQDAPSSLDDVALAQQALWRCEDRLSVRLGPDHPAVVRFLEAVEHLGTVTSLVVEARLHEGMDHERYRESAQAREAAMTAQKAFYGETKKLLGLGAR
jgi:hypothetical protein